VTSAAAPGATAVAAVVSDNTSSLSAAGRGVAPVAFRPLAGLDLV